MLDTIRRHLAALTSSSWTDFRATLAADAIYEEVPNRLRVVGAEQYVACIQHWKAAFPDLKATVTRGYTIGERVIVEIEWEGTHSGSFEGVFGKLAPTHRRGRVNGVIVFTLKSGKIAETKHYFDLLTVLTQLGVSATAITASPAGGSPPL